MSKQNTPEDMKNRLNFASLCRILREATDNRLWVPDCDTGKSGQIRSRAKQEQVVDTVYSLLLTEQDNMVAAKEKQASLLCSNKYAVNRDFRQKAEEDGAAECIRQNFEKYIFQNMSDLQRRVFLDKLQNLVDGLPSDQDLFRLKPMMGLQYTGENKDAYCNAVAECIRFCFIAPNEYKDIPTVSAFSRKPNDILQYDPYSFSGQYSKSGAVRMTLREDCPHGGRTLYDGYNYEQCLEYILEHSVVIKSIDCSLSAIEMVCVPLEESPYQLKRVGPEDYEQARRVVFRYEHEFRKKKWWKKPLSEMVYHGLVCGKWTGYAYYNDKGDIVAYLDYKVRTDGDFELGTQITMPSCRKRNLATGLIHFFQFKFMNARFFAGTYEENDGMRRVFEKTGFQEHFFRDPETGDVSNRIQERINLEFPDDDAKMTNSVYYYANSLLMATRLGAEMADSETGLAAPEETE